MPTVQKLETTLGAVVTDVKLASMDDGQWQTVLNAFHEHALLIFPAQHLSDDEQVQFAERFGDIELRLIAGERAFGGKKALCLIAHWVAGEQP